MRYTLRVRLRGQPVGVKTDRKEKREFEYVHKGFFRSHSEPSSFKTFFRLVTDKSKEERQAKENERVDICMALNDERRTPVILYNVTPCPVNDFETLFL